MRFFNRQQSAIVVGMYKKHKGNGYRKISHRL